MVSGHPADHDHNQNSEPQPPRVHLCSVNLSLQKGGCLLLMALVADHPDRSLTHMLA